MAKNEKNRLAHLGKKLSPEQCKKISEGHRGLILSEQHKEKLREAAKRDWARRRLKNKFYSEQT